MTLFFIWRLFSSFGDSFLHSPSLFFIHRLFSLFTDAFFHLLTLFFIFTTLSMPNYSFRSSSFLRLLQSKHSSLPFPSSSPLQLFLFCLLLFYSLQLCLLILILSPIPTTFRNHDETRSGSGGKETTTNTFTSKMPTTLNELHLKCPPRTFELQTFIYQNTFTVDPHPLSLFL